MSAQNKKSTNSLRKKLPKKPKISDPDKLTVSEPDWSSPVLPPEQFLYGRKGPWPQPSPSHPLKEAAEVLNIPPLETLLWNQTIGARYLMDREGYPPVAAAKAVAGCNLLLPDDQQFNNMMLKTAYTRFTKALSDADKKRIGSGNFDWKYDFSAMALVQPLDGFYCAPVVCYFTKAGGCELIEFRSRERDGKSVLVGKGQPAWNLAKVFALQGASYHILFVVHPQLHFPMDSVNAITKTAVPHIHPLFQLLYPHTSYSLNQDNAVLEGPESVVNANAQGTWFDPFMGGSYNLKLLFGAGYAGLNTEDNPDPYYDRYAYPPYDYMKPWAKGMPDKYDYGWCLRSYYKVVSKFCETVAGLIRKKNQKDPYVKRWAQYNSTYVQGFPDEHEIFSERNLTETMTIFLWDVTVSHGADHYSFANQISAPINLPLPEDVSKISAAYKFLRIRVPPPTSPNDGKGITLVGHVTNADDLYRTEMAQQMFFMPNAIRPNLINTYYAFTDPELLTAQDEFHAKLKIASDEISARQVPFIPLVEGAGVPAAMTIPASIQY